MALDAAVPTNDAPPAAAAAAAAPADTTDFLRSMSAPDLAKYQATGELPGATEETIAEGSSPSEPAAQVVETATDVKPPSEAAKPKGAEARAAELKAEIDGLLKQRADLRKEVQPPPHQPTSTTVTAPVTVALGPEPDSTDYTKYPLGTSDPQYLRDLAGHMAKSILHDERTLAAETDAKTRVQSENQRIASEWQTKVAAVKAKHPDVLEKFNTPIAIPVGSAADVWVLESEMGPETLYHLYDHPDEVTRIMALSPVRQLEAMVLLGLQIAAPAVKTKTDAPAPVPTLDTRPSAGSNDADAALARGDVDAYMRLENERELAKSGIRVRK